MDIATPAPAVTLRSRREQLKVSVGLDVSGFGPMNVSRNGYPLTLSSVTLVATHDENVRSVLLYAHGKNRWGVEQSGSWGLPAATSAPSYDSQNPYIGRITDLPCELLDAVEAAAGIRFADYTAPAED